MSNIDKRYNRNFQWYSSYYGQQITPDQFNSGIAKDGQIGLQGVIQNLASPQGEISIITGLDPTNGTYGISINSGWILHNGSVVNVSGTVFSGEDNYLVGITTDNVLAIGTSLSFDTNYRAIAGIVEGLYYDLRDKYNVDGYKYVKFLSGYHIKSNIFEATIISGTITTSYINSNYSQGSGYYVYDSITVYNDNKTDYKTVEVNGSITLSNLLLDNMPVIINGNNNLTLNSPIISGLDYVINDTIIKDCYLDNAYVTFNRCTFSGCLIDGNNGGRKIYDKCYMFLTGTDSNIMVIRNNSTIRKSYLTITGNYLIMEITGSYIDISDNIINFYPRSIGNNSAGCNIGGNNISINNNIIHCSGGTYSFMMGNGFASPLGLTTFAFCGNSIDIIRDGGTDFGFNFVGAVDMRFNNNSITDTSAHRSNISSSKKFTFCNNYISGMGGIEGILDITTASSGIITNNILCNGTRGSASSSTIVDHNVIT